LTRYRILSFSWGAAVALLVCLAAPAQAGTAGNTGRETSEVPGPAALTLAAWVTASADAGGQPFLIVDKLAARVLAFDAAGGLVAGTPALLGAARGDESPPGIGQRPLAQIGPALRITPAGRYDAHLGQNLAGRRILWVDYDSALSLHAVVTSKPKERRLERLATSSVQDNRISYGCINVPAGFFEDVVVQLFGPANGVVYILPEDSASSGEMPRQD
jgi:hypothetical protein